MRMFDTDPAWLKAAWAAEGQREFPGPASNGWIEALWLRQPGGRWFWETVGKRDDSKLPWCGAFAADCMRQAGLPFPQHYARAAAWAEYGVRLDRPARGCIVTFNKAGQNHVGFIVGETVNGNLLVLGGNQNDAVKVSEFVRRHATSYRYPPGVPLPAYTQLALGGAELSTSET